MEIATLTREDGKTKIKVLKQKEVEELIKKHEAEEAKSEKEKKEKEQREKDKWAERDSCPSLRCCFVFYIKSLETDACVVFVPKWSVSVNNFLELDFALIKINVIWMNSSFI